MRETPTPIDCAEARRRLWEYLDDELTAGLVAQIRLHLASCRTCAGFVDLERRFLAAVADLEPSSHATPEIRDRVVTALHGAGLLPPDSSP